jgi:putative sterol carrier protein
VTARRDDEEIAVDISVMTPEEFAEIMADSDDDRVRQVLDDAGTAAALDRVFVIMQDRFLPEKAGDRTATVQWRISDGDEVHSYVVDIADGTCSTRGGDTEDRDATIKVDAVRFLRIAAGQANPTKLLLTRKLKVAGDIALAKKLDSFFDIPQA